MATLLGDFLEVGEEPRVDAGGGVDFCDGPAVSEGGLQPEDAFGIGDLEFAGDFVTGRVWRILGIEAKTPAAGFQRAQAFLNGLLEGATDGHRLTHGFHRGGQHRIGGGKLLEGEARHLGDHVVDGRLEGGGRLTGDVVRQLVEGIADGEFGGDFCDRETGGLGGERGRARDARVHLDDDHAAGLGIGGELDVRAAGFHADFADARKRGVAHDLVFPVR